MPEQDRGNANENFFQPLHDILPQDQSGQEQGESLVDLSDEVVKRLINFRSKLIDKEGSIDHAAQEVNLGQKRLNFAKWLVDNNRVKDR